MSHQKLRRAFVGWHVACRLAAGSGHNLDFNHRHQLTVEKTEQILFPEKWCFSDYFLVFFHKRTPGPSSGTPMNSTPAFSRAPFMRIADETVPPIRPLFASRRFTVPRLIPECFANTAWSQPNS